MEQPAELEIILQHIGHADDRVLRHVEGQFDAGRRHARPARAEENRRRWRIEDGRWNFFAQRGNQFRREQIPARLTGDEHEGFWFQRLRGDLLAAIRMASRSLYCPVERSPSISMPTSLWTSFLDSWN